MGRTRVAFSIWLSEGEGTPVKRKKKPGMDVTLFMKIRISLSLVLTLGVAYIALACEEGGERWKLLPDPQSPIWVGTVMALIVAGLGLLVWERALNARFAAVAVLTLGIFYIAFALDGGFDLPALPRGEDRRLWEGAMCALTVACIALFVWQKREEPPALDALPPNTYIVTSRAAPVRPGQGVQMRRPLRSARRPSQWRAHRRLASRPPGGRSPLDQREGLPQGRSGALKSGAGDGRARAALQRPRQGLRIRGDRSARRQAGSPERRRLASRPHRWSDLLGQPGGNATVRWRQRIKAIDGRALSQR